MVTISMYLSTICFDFIEQFLSMLSLQIEIDQIFTYLSISFLFWYQVSLISKKYFVRYFQIYIVKNAYFEKSTKTIRKFVKV